VILSRGNASASASLAAGLADRPALRANQLAPLLDERTSSAHWARWPVGQALVAAFFITFDARFAARIHRHLPTSVPGILKEWKLALASPKNPGTASLGRWQVGLD
jgi:hypothetical protein